jgi:N-acetylneuraminic acid mutarotase
MPADERGTRSVCCSEALGLTRRQFISASGKTALLVGMGIGVAACGTEGLGLPRMQGTWASLGNAPFTRHAHSGAPSGGRLLVMGDRRGVSLEESAPVAEEAEMTIHFFGREFEFETSDPVDVPAGVPVRVILTNEGLIDHDITFPRAGVYLRAAPGETAETIAVFDAPEVYFCSIGGHAEGGMVGELLVDGQHPAEDDISLGTGSTEMWWYDPESNQWEEAPTLPHSYDHVTMVSLGEDVYSIGGYTGDIGSSRADVLVLRSRSEEWEPRSDLPVARGAMAGASDGDRIFVTGGRSEAEGTPSATDVFAYSPEDDSWTVVETNLPTGRDHVAGTVIDGVFWVIGGRGDGRRVSSTPVTEGLVIETGEWIEGPQVPVPTSANGVVSIGGRAVVFGGEGPASTPSGAAGRSYEVFPETFLYDPASNIWLRGPNAPLGVHHPAYGVIDETLYVVGGGPVSGVSATRAVQAFGLS